MTSQDFKAMAEGKMSEHEIHVAVVKYIAHKYPLAKIHHSMNEGKRGWKAQAAVKQLCVSKGFPDLLILDWRAPRLLFLELKRLKESKTSAEQKEWLAWLKDAGHVVALAKGLDSAIEAVDGFFTS